MGCTLCFKSLNFSHVKLHWIVSYTDIYAIQIYVFIYKRCLYTASMIYEATVTEKVN